MLSLKLTFDNELGRRIAVMVGRRPMPGEPTVEECHIVIEGPDSKSENILTMKEARELHHLLSTMTK